MSDARALFGQDGSVTVLASPCDGTAAQTQLGFADSIERATTLLTEAGYTLGPGVGGQWTPVAEPVRRPAYAVDVRSPLVRTPAREGNNPSRIPAADRITNAVAAALRPVKNAPAFRRPGGDIDLAGVASQADLSASDLLLCDLARAIVHGDGNVELGRHLAYLRDTHVSAIITALAASRGWAVEIDTAP